MNSASAPVAQFMCPGCSRAFKQKRSYTNHVILCMSAGGKRGAAISPTFEQLVDMVVGMNRRLVTAEERIAKAERFIDRKTSMGVWMDAHVTPSAPFDVWAQGWATRADAAVVLAVVQLGGAEGFRVLAQQIGADPAGRHTFPLQCFANKPGVFWVKGWADDTASTSSSSSPSPTPSSPSPEKWSHCPDRAFKWWTSRVHSVIVRTMTAWRQRGIHDCGDAENYNARVMQLMDTPHLCAAFKDALFSELKQDMSVCVWSGDD
jgi:hypothetical protein